MKESPFIWWFGDAKFGFSSGGQPIFPDIFSCLYHKKAVCNGFLNKAYGLDDFTGKGTFNPKQVENRRLQNSCLVCSIPSLKLTARTWKWMVARWVSFWGPASFKLLVLGRAFFLVGDDYFRIFIVQGVCSKMKWIPTLPHLGITIQNLKLNGSKKYLKDVSFPTYACNFLGGGFKYFLFSPLFGEDSHFD